MGKFTLLASAAIALIATSPAANAQSTGGPVSLQEAIAVAMQSNPEIIQAQMNKEAIEFERRQAQGLYQPRVDLEASAGVRATYNVVGTFLDDVRSAIERDGHTLAFHSFDHSDDGDQLHRCREVDYRLKGYRLPRSRGTPETTDENLAFHNFEWLASGRVPLGTDLPVLRDRLVRLPVTLDDFPLYTGRQAYDEWESALLGQVERAIDYLEQSFKIGREIQDPRMVQFVSANLERLRDGGTGKP